MERTARWLLQEVGLARALGDPARGPYYRWLFYAAGALEGAIGDRSLGLEVLANKKKIVGYGNFSVVMDAPDGAVGGGGWLAGDRFSAADLISARTSYGA